MIKRAFVQVLPYLFLERKRDRLRPAAGATTGQRVDFFAGVCARVESRPASSNRYVQLVLA
jgi:hypothetical protein